MAPRDSNLRGTSTEGGTRDDIGPGDEGPRDDGTRSRDAFDRRREHEPAYPGPERRRASRR